MTPLNGPALEKAARENYKLECADIDVEPTPWDVLDEGLKELYRLQVTRGVTAYRDALPQARLVEPSLKEIFDDHPANSGRHDAYEMAMRLVGERHEKSSLVSLVGHLLLRAQRATLISGVELPGWVDIESVPPKNGERVLVGGPADGDSPTDRGWVAEAEWHEDEKGWWLAGSDPTDAWDGRVYPTHRRPLPPPPTGDAP